MTNEVYQYEILQPKHIEQAIEVMTESFCGYEPMTHFLHMAPHEFEPFARLAIEKAAKDGLSIVALYQNKVVACTVVEDIADPQDFSAVLNPKFDIIFDLLEHLSGDFLKDKIFEKGHVAHLFITAVHSAHHHHGLSREINFRSMSAASSKNFEFMCSEFTHFLNRLGTVKYIPYDKLLIRSYKYDEYDFRGAKPFKGLEGAADSYLWQIKPGAQLRYKQAETKQQLTKPLTEFFFE